MSLYYRLHSGTWLLTWQEWETPDATVMQVSHPREKRPTRGRWVAHSQEYQTQDEAVDAARELLLAGHRVSTL
jgi:hypothetical protein